MRKTAFSMVVLTFIGLSPAVTLGQFDEPKTTDSAATASNSEIRDPAGMFGRDAVRESLSRLISIERTYRVPTTIETVESLHGDPGEQVALRMAKRLGAQAKGVFVLLSKTDRHIEVLISKDNTAIGNSASRTAIRDAFLEEFRAKRFDEGLKKGVETIEKLLATAKADAPKPVATTASASATAIQLPMPKLEAVTGSLVRRNAVKMTNAGAKRLLAAAEATATSKGYRMNFAIVDDGGHLIAFSRMDDARPASAYTAITKATSAATFRTKTGPMLSKATAEPADVLHNLSIANAAAASGGKVTPLPGGLPVVVDGQVIGAIGIGGGTGEQDVEVATAAITQFLEDLKPAEAPKAN
jgi:glc operon protein GlcG